MKNKRMKIAALGTAFTLLGTGIGYAAGEWENIWVQFDSVNLLVNGQNVTSANLLYNDRTYVPLRACAEMLGGTVGWDQNSNTASIDLENNLEIDNSSLSAVGILMHRLDEILKLSSNLVLSYTTCVSAANEIKLNGSTANETYNYSLDILNGTIEQYNQFVNYVVDIENNSKILNLDFSRAYEMMQNYGYCIDNIKLAFDNIDLFMSTGDNTYFKSAGEFANKAYYNIEDGDIIRNDYYNQVYQYTQQ